MTWFKVDDKFWSHPKTIMLGLDAVGLWTMAGTWCAGHLTDGVIPATILQRISPERPAKTKRLAEELVAAGLWVVDGDNYRFHQWLDHQPSREKVEAERAAGRERQERSRTRRRLATVTNLSRRDTRRDTGVSHSDPTRPDPTIDTAPVGSAVSIAGDAAACEHGDPRCDGTRCVMCRKSANGG